MKIGSPRGRCDKNHVPLVWSRTEGDRAFCQIPFHSRHDVAGDGQRSWKKIANIIAGKLFGTIGQNEAAADGAFPP